MSATGMPKPRASRRWWGAAAAGVLALGLGGCGIPDEEEAGADGPLTVGIIAPLSGALAEDGNAYADAAQAALEALQDDLGQEIEVVVYDEASETAEAVSGTRRLIQSDEVDALLSGSTSGNFLATRQFIDQAQIPVLTIATATAVVEDNAGWTFRVSQPLPDRIDDNVQFIVDQLGAQSVGFLQVNDESQRAFADGVKGQLGEAGIEVASEQYFQYGDSDFSPYLQELRSSTPDVTFLGCEVTQCAAIIDQANAAGVMTNFVLPTAASSQGFLDSFGDVSEGAYVQTIYAPGAVEETAEFEQLAEESDFAASYYGVVGFTEATVLVEAVREAGSTEPQAIQEALAGGSYESPLGEISFADNGQGEVPGYVAQIADSQYVYTWPET